MWKSTVLHPFLFFSCTDSLLDICAFFLPLITQLSVFSLFFPLFHLIHRTLLSALSLSLFHLFLLYLSRSYSSLVSLCLTQEPRQTMGMWSFSPPVEQEQDAADARLDDVYRYALVLWCTLAARWPFDEALTGELSTEFEFLRAVNNGLRPAPLVGLSSAVQDLLHALWAREPSQVRSNEEEAGLGHAKL